jgi:xanthine dehydrogenase iron-sulfur cluster and FAD-binding subunit A
MRLLQIRARTEEDADCLIRELAVYSPRRLKRSVLFELEERSQTDLLAMLAAVETCLAANEIRSVRIELDGKKYTMAPSELSR